MTENDEQRAMNNEQRNTGFSLAEVLLAIGALAVGMIFVAGVFPVSVYLTTVVSEQTIAAVAADEAFAKVKIYGVNLSSPLWQTSNPTTCVDFNSVPSTTINPSEFAYPSTNTVAVKQYYWSALCRGVDTNSPTNGRLVQVTVFVSRKASPNLTYYTPSGGNDGDWPVPMKVGVSKTTNNNELQITGNKTFINDGYTIVDDQTGQIYRVLERYASPNDSTILLDRSWGGGPSGNVWVVPPPVAGGIGPCVGLYQKVIRF
jgi:Tfp pilus assembly protein PilV